MSKQKHIMLSYQWDSQALVRRVHQHLVEARFRVWMDIYGGMYGDINDAMAEGVERAGIVCIFMTERYQISRNCKRELSYAAKRDVIIVPVMAQASTPDGDHFSPSGWLGVLTSSLLYTEITDTSDFEQAMSMLVMEIERQCINNSLDLTDATFQSAQPLPTVAATSSSVTSLKSVTRTSLRSNNIEVLSGSPNSRLILAVPHGGALKPSNVPSRTAGCCGEVSCKSFRESIQTQSSLHTIEMGKLVREAIFKKMGEAPHLVINNLHRSKMDADRDVDNGAQHNETAVEAWEDYHQAVADARQEVGGGGGGGLLVVLKGHAHPASMVEVGYAVPGLALRKGASALAGNTSVNNLMKTGGFSVEDVIWGHASLGGMLCQEGDYTVVPSPNTRAPVKGHAYISGGYSIKEWGSKFGGRVDAVSLALPKDVRKNYQEEATKIANALAGFVGEYYSICST